MKGHNEKLPLRAAPITIFAHTEVLITSSLLKHMGVRHFCKVDALRQGIEVESPKRVGFVWWPDLERIARWRLAMPPKKLFAKLSYTQAYQLSGTIKKRWELLAEEQWKGGGCGIAPLRRF